LRREPDNDKACRYKGIAVYQRLLTLRESETSKQQLLNEEARKYLLKSVRGQDERGATHIVLAKLYELDGDAVNAVEHARRACTLEPDEVDHWFCLGMLWQKAGNLEEAEKIYCRA